MNIKFLNARSNSVLVAGLSLALGASLATQWHGSHLQAQTGAPPARKVLLPEQKAVLHSLQDAFATIAQNAEPFVVTVTARAATAERAPSADRQDGQDRQRAPRLRQQPPGGTPDFPFEFFQREFGNSPDGPEMEPRGASTGSGVIIREVGGAYYVLTNHHVVRGRDRIRVELLDKSNHAAEIVGTDERSDLAVLKFSPKNRLPAGFVATLGDSDRARVGEWVMAIGSPLDYKTTLTVGVISAKGRSLDQFGRSASNYSDLIQTDASINPGNSGGPLINLDGEVIGINVAIAPGGGGGNIGIGFAIPATTARMVTEQLITKGKVVRGYLGVGTHHRELEPELREHLKVDGGALVETIGPDTPAAKAGLKPGDVVVRFADRPVASFTELEQAVALVTPGTSVPVVVIREGKQTTLQVKVVERPANLETPLIDQGQQERPAPAQRPVRSKFGLMVRQAPEGVQVTAVAPGSEADQSGVNPGDVVTHVGETSVKSVDEFQKAVNTLGNAQGCIMKMKTADGVRYCVIRP